MVDYRNHLSRKDAIKALMSNSSRVGRGTVTCDRAE